MFICTILVCKACLHKETHIRSKSSLSWNFIRAEKASEYKQDDLYSISMQGKSSNTFKNYLGMDISSGCLDMGRDFFPNGKSH